MDDGTSESMQVQLAVNVPLDPEPAFALFVEGMNSWWPPEVHTLPSETCVIRVEPRLGGRWFEQSPVGDEADWGSVHVYEPPHRLVLSWQLLPDAAYDPAVDDYPGVSYDADLLTELELTFTATDGGGARVAVRHHKLENLGDGPAADEIRGLLAGEMIGWPAIVGRYATFATQTPEASVESRRAHDVHGTFAGRPHAASSAVPPG